MRKHTCEQVAEVLWATVGADCAALCKLTATLESYFARLGHPEVGGELRVFLGS